MADKRSEYVVKIGGQDHVLLLSEDDASRYVGAVKQEGAAKKLAEASTKALQAANKAVQAPLNK